MHFWPTSITSFLMYHIIFKYEKVKKGGFTYNSHPYLPPLDQDLMAKMQWGPFVWWADGEDWTGMGHYLHMICCELKLHCLPFHILQRPNLASFLKRKRLKKKKRLCDHVLTYCSCVHYEWPHNEDSSEMKKKKKNSTGSWSKTSHHPPSSFF